MISWQVKQRCRRASGICTRAVAIVASGGLLLQATAGGCSQTLDDLAGTLGQNVVEGIGAGVSNLTEALLLNLLV